MSEPVNIIGSSAGAPPEKVERPALALWLWQRGIDFRTAAKGIGGVSHETVRRWCLPFADLDRREPGADEAERVERYTAGEIPPDSFKAPE